MSSEVTGYCETCEQNGNQFPVVALKKVWHGGPVDHWVCCVCGSECEPSENHEDDLLKAKKKRHAR